MAVTHISREPKKGSFGKTELFSLAIGQVIGAGIITYSVISLQLTGYSVWLAYLIAIILGFALSLPMMFMASAFRIGGGFYSVVSSTLGAKYAGIYAFMCIPPILGNAIFALSASEYLGDAFAIISSPMTKRIIALGLMVFFVAINLLGKDIMAKFQKGMVWLLLGALLMYIGFAIPKIHLPIFDFNDPGFMPFGVFQFSDGVLTAGLFAAVFILISSTHGYSNVFAYSGLSKNPKKDIPFAMILTAACLVVLYLGVSFAAAGTTSLEEYGNSLTLVISARKVLPGVLFYIFLVCGPIMALTTTLNASISNSPIAIGQSCEDGWLPKWLAKKNKHGAYVYILLIIGILGILPIALNFSIGVILNDIQLLFSVTTFLHYFAIYGLPDKYPEIWKQNSLHVSGKLHKACCIVAILINLVIFVKSCLSLNLTIVIVSIAALLVCVILGLNRAKKADVTIYDSIWPE